MLKVFSIVVFFWFVNPSFPFSNKQSKNVSVKVNLIDPVSSGGFLVKIDVQNLSDKEMKVLKDRTWDYKWDRIKSIGNYIVQIEKQTDSAFKLFPPSADIDFSPSIDRPYITIGKLGTISETHYIDGNLFSRYENKTRGFPPGTYRLKISFNASEWSSSEENSSEWIIFRID